MQNLAISVLSLFCLPTLGQVALNPAQPRPQERSPVYQVTVVQRSITAINYGHRTGATNIDFTGTVLLPKAHGKARVQSNRGAVKIEAEFDRLNAPTQFGAQYLTYVLWAITPNGRANNLGEIVTDSKDNAKVTVTAPFQAFGLMVTAEPYFAVTQPSDLVVLENAVRPDTMGRAEPVQASYELLPRGQYTLNIGASANQPKAPMVSLDEYNALLALYEAANAVQIARSAGADVYAPDVFQKAVQLLDQAQSDKSHKAKASTVITTAREAAQRAEDARLITVKKKAGEPALARIQQAR